MSRSRTLSLALVPGVIVGMVVALPASSASAVATTAPPAAYAPDPNAYAPSQSTIGAGPTDISVTGYSALIVHPGTNQVSQISLCMPKSCLPGQPYQSAVPGTPTAVAVSADARVAYVVAQATDSVAVLALPQYGISPSSPATVTTNVPVGSHPSAIALNRSTTALYVANSGGNSVSVINPATNMVVATIPVGAAPLGVAVSPAGDRVYVANSQGGTVSVIDAATNTVMTTIPVGAGPSGVTVAATRVLVANSGAGTVSIIDAATNAVVATVPVGTQPRAVVATTDGLTAFVANAGSGTVAVLDPAAGRVVATVTVGGSPQGVSFGGSATAYVTDATTNTLSVIPTVAPALAVNWSSRRSTRTITGVVPRIGAVAYRIVARSGNRTRTGSCATRGTANIACTVRVPRGRWRVSVTTQLPWQRGTSGNQNRTFRF